MTTLHATHRQRGATLVMAMIFVVIMALFATIAFNTSTGSMRVIGNMQARQEAISVAQKAIEQTISSTDFATKPSTVAATPILVNIDGGAVTYVASMLPTPTCYRTKVIKTSELDLSSAADMSCLQSGKVEQGGIDIAGSANTAGNSMCSNTEWNIGASVTDPSSGTVVVANQGVALRVLTADADNACPN
ncbi:MAG: pilus assembly PilX N-terminal domain-containing protein [Rhodoferax sp.]|nr:pilus assembly PilX N-terminal domain-containing protein [Rhodoferax sp.]